VSLCVHCGKNFPLSKNDTDPPVIITRKGSKNIYFHSNCFLEVAGDEYFPKELSVNDVDALIDEANKIHKMYGTGTYWINNKPFPPLPPFKPTSKPVYDRGKPIYDIEIPIKFPTEVIKADLDLFEDRMEKELRKKEEKDMIEKKSLFDRFIKWWD